MTLQEAYNTIKATALAQPNIHTIEDEFIKLNREDTKYSAIIIQQREHLREQDFITYNFYLGYVDRLLEDKSNEIEIQSTGVNVLNNIVNYIRQTFFPAIEITAGQFVVFNQRFTAECAGVYTALSVNVPISECTDYDSNIFERLNKTITTNGSYHYVPVGVAFDDVNITVNVPTERKPEETCTQTITTNGTQTFNPQEGYAFDKAVITTDVHPTNALSKTYTTNGTKTETGEWKNATIVVNVPEQKPEETFTISPTTSSQTVIPTQGHVFSGGTVNAVTSSIDANIVAGNIKDGISILGVTGTYDNQKPEDTLTQTITSNGTHEYNPTSGHVFDKAVITTDIHPTTALSKTYTTNGVKTITGEYKDGTITVNVPEQKLEDTLTRTITSNSTQTFTPASGHVFDKAVITTDIHPTTALSKTYTTNGTKTETGEWKNATIVVNVPEQKPEDTISATYTTNGVKTLTPTSGHVFSGGTVTVNVPEQKPEDTISATYTTNGVKTLTPTSGHVFSGGTVTVNVPEQKPEEAFSETYTANGSYNIIPTEGSVFSGGNVIVNVPTPVHELQDKTVTPATSQQSIYADEGYYGLDKVTVNAVTAAIDSNIIAGNIKDGVTILGVEGTFEGGSLQQKTVNPSQTLQEITPDSPNYGLSKVTVAAAPLQNKTVNPSTSQQSITADSGNYGLGTVTVAAAPLQIKDAYPSQDEQTITSDDEYFGLEEVKIGAAPLQNKTVNPSTSQQSITADSGNYGLGTVTVNAVTSAIDSNIVAGNIKDGVTILGVEGNVIELDAQSKNYNITTNGTTLITPDSGYNAINSGNITVDVHPTTALNETYTTNGVKTITGEYKNGTITVNVDPRKPEETLVQTITSNGTQTFNPTTGSVFTSATITTNVQPSLQDKTVTPTTSQQIISADEGYYGLDDVTINAVTSSIDSNIVAGNIKKDVTILGVTGTYDNRKPEEAISETYTTNGVKTLTPTEGSVFSGGTVTINIPTLTDLFSNVGSTKNVFYYDGDDSGDYSAIIAALPSGWTAVALHNLIVNTDPDDIIVNIAVS